LILFKFVFAGGQEINRGYRGYIKDPSMTQDLFDKMEYKLINVMQWGQEINRGYIKDPSNDSRTLCDKMEYKLINVVLLNLNGI